MKTGLLADLTKLLLTMSLVLAVPIGVTAAAEDDLPPHATLKDLLDFSESNNSAAMDAHEQWRAAGERISQSKALPDPRFEYDIEHLCLCHFQSLFSFDSCGLHLRPPLC